MFFYNYIFYNFSTWRIFVFFFSDAFLDSLSEFFDDDDLSDDDEEDRRPSEIFMFNIFSLIFSIVSELKDFLMTSSFLVTSPLCGWLAVSLRTRVLMTLFGSGLLSGGSRPGCSSSLLWLVVCVMLTGCWWWAAAAAGARGWLVVAGRKKGLDTLRGGGSRGSTSAPDESLHR